jgi:hypothetical protein
MNQYDRFAAMLAETLTQNESRYLPHPDNPSKIQIYSSENEIAALDLTPFTATPCAVTAYKYFDGILSIKELLDAYRSARNDYVFEDDIFEATAHLSDYAPHFLSEILENAKQRFSDNQASIIANWIKHLDVYTAVKAVESLLNSCADLKLLELSQEKDWFIHFDHLAIRCGSKANNDAERVVHLLTEHHGYSPSQAPGEAFYQFSEGWNAYPLYKILENGQVLRVFVDQSDADAPSQIIQHWNRIYGYTSHHLAMRATRFDAQGQREAVYLDEVITTLEQNGIAILTPTGHYTRGLLLQVFTKPEKNTRIPPELKQSIVAINANLEKSIENGKLLELVSRAELPLNLAEQLYALYGLQFDAQNPIHSAPVYQYFLPAQAAHVIKTSIQTG